LKNTQRFVATPKQAKEQAKNDVNNSSVIASSILRVAKAHFQ